MAIQYRAHVNLNKNELQNPRIHPLGGAPSSPVGGQIYYNTADGNLYLWDDVGNAWVDLTSQGTTSPDATTTTKGLVRLAGDLTGTADSPQIASGVITDAEVAAANKDGTAATPSLRTLGTGAQQAAAGNHTHSQLHDQNTDLGTSSTSFYLVGTALNDVRIKKSANGELSIRTGDDSGFASLQSGALTVNGNLTVTGTTTTVNSNTVSVGDNIIELNNDVATTAASTEDAGITIRRYTGADVRQDAQNIWSESLDRWTYVFPASAGTGTVTRVAALKHTETLGAVTGGTPVTVTHGLNTREVAVGVRDTATNELVFADVVANAVDTVQVTFSANASAGAYAVTIIG